MKHDRSLFVVSTVAAPVVVVLGWAAMVALLLRAWIKRMVGKGRTR